MDFDKLSEKELLNACIQGSKEAWDAFVEKYTNLIYHTINKTLKIYYADHLYQDSSDIHNDVFLSLMENNWKKLRQYEGRNGCTVSSWLMVVTTNFTLNFIKKQKQRIPIEDNTTDNMDVIEKVSNPQQQPDEELSEKEYGEVFKELINDLNANDMLFLKLYYEKELPPEEIAEMLNLTVSTVYSKKNRIIEKLIKIAKKKNILQEN
ncbi:MAG: RNA polymerase sigma factor [Candidatus Scalindua rubra]|uniref:RNA polymerase sigma factor n=1 Tax=Candidatus Scalindua rubra TaxID=1872076 RepID=A0A1E3X7K1_9BACT|nr:MAG: RNA polymerase sigma factor [Candidatus Scalindua rubra]